MNDRSNTITDQTENRKPEKLNLADGFYALAESEAYGIYGPGGRLFGLNPAEVEFESGSLNLYLQVFIAGANGGRAEMRQRTQELLKFL